MAALHGWQPRLGTGLNIMTDSNTGRKYSFVSTPAQITLDGTPFSPEIMNELEQAIANSEILYFDAAPTTGTPGALGQFGAYDGMIYYCTGVSISMSYGSIQPGTYYFYAQNLPYSFTLSTQQTGLAFDGATLTAGGQAVLTNCWPQGTEITLNDGSTYQWTALQPAASTIPISDVLSASIGLPTNSTVADALAKMQTGIFLSNLSPTVTALTATQYGLSGQYVKGVAYGNGVYIAMIDSSTLLKSTNGSTWELVTISNPPLTGSINAVTFGNGVFVAVGDGLMTSQDGVTWTSPSGAPVGIFTGVAYSGGMWVLTASAGISYSQDVSYGWLVDSQYTGLNALCVANGTFYAVGASAYYTSTDGSTWTEHSGYGGNFIATDSDGNILISSASGSVSFYNGSAWSTESLGGTVCGLFLSDGTPYILNETQILNLNGEEIAVSGAVVNPLSSASVANERLFIGGNGAVIISGPVYGAAVDGAGSPANFSVLGVDVGNALLRLGGNLQTLGEIAAFDTPGHNVGVTYDNTYALFDGTSPSIAIDGTVIPLLRRSQFDYKTTVNLDNIRAGVYWINGYGSGITGTVPFTSAHYLLISTGTLNNTLQVAITTASGHEIKTRYRANDGSWGAWA